jgi:hypothetical protein
VRVKDLGSTNGTWWQGSRITELVVPGGSTIEIGGAVVRIVAADAMVLPPSSKTRFGALVGQSMAMRELFAVLELAAPSDATVLVEGESGTGKELVAKAVHDHSARARGPFVVVDCSAIAEHLIDSHLFGHVRGAFTGAERDRKGAFVEASGGTLFLDELGELPLRGAGQAVARARGPDRATGGRRQAGRRSTPGWSPRPTATWRGWSTPRSSASTCSTGWRWCTSRCRRCASGPMICRS